MKKRRQAGFTVVELLLILILVAIVVFVGYYIYHNQANPKTNSKSVISMAAKNTPATTPPDSSHSKPSQDFLTVTNFGIKIPLPTDLMNDIQFYATSGTTTHPTAAGETTDTFPGQVEFYSDNIQKLCGSVQDSEPLFLVTRDDSDTSVVHGAGGFSVSADGHIYWVSPMATPDSNGCTTTTAKQVFSTTYQALLDGLKNAESE